MSDLTCFKFPLECPKCSAVSAMPYMASALPDGGTAVDVRCQNCQNEWRCMLQPSAPILTMPDLGKTP